MLTAAQVTPTPASTGRVLEDTDGGDNPIINNVGPLKKGFIKTSKSKANTPYTILLVGETGVGKSSFLELIANVFAGNDIDHYNFNTLDQTNERGGSDNQSQTMEARLYKFTSNDGTVVRILDTPGFAATRHVQQDEHHKRSVENQIKTQIKNHIGSITAVLVLANGTVPRVTVGTDYALSTLSAIFPGLANNIAFVLTNVPSMLHLNFPGDSIPHTLKDAPQFPLSNPVALQRKACKLKDDPNMKHWKAKIHKVVKTEEQGALEMLMELFGWLDGLEPQPMDQANSAPRSSNPRRPSFISAPHPISILLALWNRLPSMYRSQA